VAVDAVPHDIVPLEDLPLAEVGCVEPPLPTCRRNASVMIVTSLTGMIFVS
jgi:hypothetical protein